MLEIHELKATLYGSANCARILWALTTRFSTYESIPAEHKNACLNVLDYYLQVQEGFRDIGADISDLLELPHEDALAARVQILDGGVKRANEIILAVAPRFRAKVYTINDVSGRGPLYMRLPLSEQIDDFNCVAPEMATQAKKMLKHLPAYFARQVHVEAKDLGLNFIALGLEQVLEDLERRERESQEELPIRPRPRVRPRGCENEGEQRSYPVRTRLGDRENQWENKTRTYPGANSRATYQGPTNKGRSRSPRNEGSYKRKRSNSRNQGSYVPFHIRRRNEKNEKERVPVHQRLQQSPKSPRGSPVNERKVVEKSPSAGGEDITSPTVQPEPEKRVTLEEIQEKVTEQISEECKKLKTEMYEELQLKRNVLQEEMAAARENLNNELRAHIADVKEALENTLSGTKKTLSKVRDDLTEETREREQKDNVNTQELVLTNVRIEQHEKTDDIFREAIQELTDRQEHMQNQIQLVEEMVQGHQPVVKICEAQQVTRDLLARSINEAEIPTEPANVPNLPPTPAAAPSPGPAPSPSSAPGATPVEPEKSKENTGVVPKRPRRKYTKHFFSSHRDAVRERQDKEKEAKQTSDVEPQQVPEVQILAAAEPMVITVEDQEQEEEYHELSIASPSLYKELDNIDDWNPPKQ